MWCRSLKSLLSYATNYCGSSQNVEIGTAVSFVFKYILDSYHMNILKPSTRWSNTRERDRERECGWRFNLLHTGIWYNAYTVICYILYHYYKKRGSFLTVFVLVDKCFLCTTCRVMFLAYSLFLAHIIVSKELTFTCNILVCSRIIVHVEDIAVYVVPRKHYLKIF